MYSLTFEPSLDHASRVLANDLVVAILNACDPQRAFIKHYDPTAINAKTHIIAMGKASIPMTNAAIECLGDQFARATVIAPPALAAQVQFKNKFVEVFVGDHPLPTQRSVAAANAIVKHAQSIPVDHQALVLLSGGTSAMVCSPKPNTTLEHIIETTNTLLRSGEPIDKINQARAELDTLKAGGLAKVLANVAHTQTYTLSDVIGNDLSIIASAPTYIVDSQTNQQSAQSPHTIIASNRSAVDAVIAWAGHERISIAHTNRSALGSSAHEGRCLARRLMNQSEDSSARNTPGPIAVCLGGEPTVNASQTTGVGGPMLELALACALELAQESEGKPMSHSMGNWVVFAFATDGCDGPTNAAGAIITSAMLRSPQAIAQVQRALVDHNALHACDAIGATLRTGHTATNVNDIAIAIRYPTG